MLYFWNTYEVTALQSGLINPANPRMASSTYSEEQNHDSQHILNSGNASSAAGARADGVGEQLSEHGLSSHNLIDDESYYLRSVDISRRLQQHQLSSILGIPIPLASPPSNAPVNNLSSVESLISSYTNEDRIASTSTNSMSPNRNFSNSQAGLYMDSRNLLRQFPNSTERSNPNLRRRSNTLRSNNYEQPKFNSNSIKATDISFKKELTADERKVNDLVMKFPDIPHRQRRKSASLDENELLKDEASLSISSSNLLSSPTSTSSHKMHPGSSYGDIGYEQEYTVFGIDPDDENNY
jgi:hypothetical protein